MKVSSIVLSTGHRFPSIIDLATMIAPFSRRVISPRLDLRVGRRLQLDNIKAGEDVYFECVIQANPRPHRVRWFLEVSVD
ncbi:hypothetical protein E2C01_031250 [Portunus trituberculatus]|uniref:Ig-like domain-containing protein n=1 Tax=Portunus trituberculatus TaxID=210409 RepID=A0A5B7EXL5_PORTR|nr:hypothetical protein [Portunus trituberculatus]